MEDAQAYADYPLNCSWPDEAGLNASGDIGGYYGEDCVWPPPPRPYQLHWTIKLAWSLLYGLMLSVATVGNSTVIWIVLAHRRMRTVTNYFLVNLSVADLLMALLNCAFNFAFMLNSDWPFGGVYCSASNFVANVTVASSAFTLAAISLDRYMAIVRPLQHRMTRRRALLALLAVWVASAALAGPCLVFSTTVTRTYAGGEESRICFLEWPDGHYPQSLTDYVYNVVFLCVTYLVPVTAMAVCYGLMGRELWGDRGIGEKTARQQEAVRSKRKVVRMLVLVVAIFASCWLPYHAYFIYAYHDPAVASSWYVQHLYLGFYWLAMANAGVNPAIYYWMNNRFRLYFQRALCRLCCSCATASKQREAQMGLTYFRNTPHSNSETTRRMRANEEGG
ncbi:tachykinin-like peptides receptor 86C [Schistocerca nitens]|uniref:tachykinin-like peptides receptor 86C n=1 Tax=Schistocerca nitens TaxID=7011 RepID=UPI002117CECD|nr:tachykinin-like peptides receptor 86C [Schistocerca nitens]